MTTETYRELEDRLPEIVIGIVSPVGTPLKSTLDALEKGFIEKKYNFHHIKITNSFHEIAQEIKYEKLDKSTRYTRITSYIDFGNHLRNKLGSRFLSAFSISKIAETRSNYSDSCNVYVVDQLKTEDEINLLKEIYGRSFFQISVYSARHVRVDSLSRDMSHDNKKRDTNFYRDKAEALVCRDEDEINQPNGQQVGKIFQLADVVVNADLIDKSDDVSVQVKRFIELLFGYNGYSPNHLEYGMYLAHSAALRSLDLSRQVGAAIFRETGEIAALGANEVPKAGGGTYWADDSFDAREYRTSQDSNDIRKSEIFNEILDIFNIDRDKISKKQQDRVKESQFMSALEYGRIIHAEMSALSDASRLGISVQGATLYCTTFPCHMCSKHIVASGISKVVFLEPYPKSLTADLHSDSVHIEGMSRGSFEKFPSVNFVPFSGITPRRYREFFARTKRKSEGRYIDYRGGSAKPMFKNDISTYLNQENVAISAVKKALENSSE
ncbi:anti-phage dCTP deaminase [Martelella mediterranea]|nr:anti-phage dCTP deaminase [Martelella mediterranea]